MSSAAGTNVSVAVDEPERGGPAAYDVTGWMYAANGIPVDRAARLTAGEAVALAGFTFASTDPGMVAADRWRWSCTAPRWNSWRPGACRLAAPEAVLASPKGVTPDLASHS